MFLALLMRGRSKLCVISWAAPRCHPREGGDPGFVWGRTRFFRLACEVGRVGPGRPPRNSLAGLVRLNRCVQDERGWRSGLQRFSQRCQARSDSRGNLPGPTRPTTALRDILGIARMRGRSKLCVISWAVPRCHPREGGDPGFVRGRRVLFVRGNRRAFYCYSA